MISVRVSIGDSTPVEWTTTDHHLVATIDNGRLSLTLTPEGGRRIVARLTQALRHIGVVTP